MICLMRTSFNNRCMIVVSWVTEDNAKTGYSNMNVYSLFMRHL